MIRAKITPVSREGGIFLKIEWCRIEDERIVEVMQTEEVLFADGGKAVSYISRAEFNDGNFRLGTFSLDAQGLRHFVLHADAVKMGVTGGNAL